MNALVIDDSRATRLILGRLLRSAGFTVTEAADGWQGLERLREQPQTALALVDWNMPEMDGLAVIQAIRANPIFKDVCVLIVSAETEPARVAAALAAGANGHLSKPFTKLALRNELEALGLVAPT